MDEDFGVGVIGAKGMAGGLELTAEFSMVIDFAVEDYLDRAILIGHGLSPARLVDDGQAAVEEGGMSARINVLAAAVGAAMGDGSGHGLQWRALEGRSRGKSDDTGNAAHGGRLTEDQTYARHGSLRCHSHRLIGPAFHRRRGWGRHQVTRGVR